jgi:hypothetical protein
LKNRFAGSTPARYQSSQEVRTTVIEALPAPRSVPGLNTEDAQFLNAALSWNMIRRRGAGQTLPISEVFRRRNKAPYLRFYFL